MLNTDFQTERLMLRRLALDDADAIFAVIGDPVAMQYYPQPFTREDAVRWIERHLRATKTTASGCWRWC